LNVYPGPGDGLNGIDVAAVSAAATVGAFTPVPVEFTVAIGVGAADGELNVELSGLFAFAPSAGFTPFTPEFIASSSAVVPAVDIFETVPLAAFASSVA
jgi:hypothetical protein